MLNLHNLHSTFLTVAVLLSFPLFQTSVIDYARPADLKKELNEKFKEKFPLIQLTLSKLRSLKKDMKKIAHGRVSHRSSLTDLYNSYFIFIKLTHMSFEHLHLHFIPC